MTLMMSNKDIENTSVLCRILFIAHLELKGRCKSLEQWSGVDDIAAPS